MKLEKTQYVYIGSGIFFVLLCALGGIYFLRDDATTTIGGNAQQELRKTNVFMDGDMQIVEITAKGGYSPRVTRAKSGIPTMIKFITHGTFDCSSAVTIPSIGFSTNLPPGGEASVNIPAQSSGSSLKGSCSMGMYHFEVQFD